MKNFINHIFQIQFQQFLRLSFMVTCQSSELDWEVTVELPADFLSLGRGSVSQSVVFKPLIKLLYRSTLQSLINRVNQPW